MRGNILLQKIELPIRIVLLFLLLTIGSLAQLFGQATNDYRSAITGNWSNLSTWERYNGTTWITPTGGQGTPTNVSGVITIRNTHSITVTANVSVDQVTIDAGGKVTINNGNTLTINNGTGTDLSVSGTLQTNSTSNNSGFTNNGSINFNSGGTYIHNVDGGPIPTATWDVASTCSINGYIKEPGGSTLQGPTPFQVSLHQTFGNFTWNSTAQTYDFSLYAQLSAINGNLTIFSTGTGAGAGSLTLGNAGTGDLSVGGNLIQSGGNFIISASGARTISIAGNFSISAGTFDMSSSTTVANYTTLNVGGNFNFTGGTITNSGSTTGSIINFNGTGTQVFTSGGTLSQKVNFAILTGATVDLGTSVIIGSSGNFTLYSGGSIITANTAGITKSGATGSIQLSGTRSYNSGANYTYNGTAAQVTGNGLNNAGTVTLSNSAGVTFSAATAMDYLIISGGSKANLGTFTTHTASALFLNGNAYSTGTWGGTGSTATNINNTYFAVATGILHLSNIVTTTYSITQDIIIPCGVTSVAVEVWGGGGAGSTRTSDGTGGGGGGGAYSIGNVTVTPLNTYKITVGGGSSNTSPGGDSWFGLATTIMAKGGNSGAQDNSAGATGGQAFAGVGTAKYNGGTGATGTGSSDTGYSGGGGSSAGTAANGNNGIANTNTGATAPAGGGNGGNGKSGSTGSGVKGFTPGGGGGGAYRNGNGTSIGGSGSNGMVSLTYASFSPTITLGSNPSVCQGTTSANLTYSSTTGCPDKYYIDYNASAIAAGFANVAFTSLPSAPIILNVPAGASVATYNGTLTVLNSTGGSPSVQYAFTVTVTASSTPTVSITANPGTSICPGTSVTFTATALGTGGGSVNYNFKVNGSSVQSGAGNTYTTTGLTNGQTVTCDINITGGTCILSTSASSNTFTMTVNQPPTTSEITTN